MWSSFNEEEIAFLADLDFLKFIYSQDSHHPQLCLFKPMIWMPIDSDCGELQISQIASWAKSLQEWLTVTYSMSLNINITQVTHCTNVNKALTTELDRYKEEVKDLKEMQNIENSFSGSNEQYAEIVRLKETLFEQVQEKDSLMKTNIPTAITRGHSWGGFEHTKAWFRDDIIPFIKRIKRYLQERAIKYLIEELADEQGFVIAALIKEVKEKLKEKLVDMEAMDSLYDPNVSKGEYGTMSHINFQTRPKTLLLQTPYVPPSRFDWDLLFQPMFDESLNPPPYVELQAPGVIAPMIPEAVTPRTLLFPEALLTNLLCSCITKGNLAWNLVASGYSHGLEKSKLMRIKKVRKLNNIAFSGCCAKSLDEITFLTDYALDSIKFQCTVITKAYCLMLQQRSKFQIQALDIDTGVLQDIGLYTSRCLMRLCRISSESTQEKDYWFRGEAETTSSPTSTPITQAQVTYVSKSVLSSKFDAKIFITWKES
ncbi:hypothetical protein Tco_1256879 [Tanacetum coccineum]